MNLARAMYKALINAVTKPNTMKATLRWSFTAAKISSLLQNPDSIGIPPKDNAPKEKTRAVKGITFLNPPIRWMSCSSVLWRTLPAPKNSNALAKPWASRWKMAAVYPNAPNESIIKPKWLMVE